VKEGYIPCIQKNKKLHRKTDEAYEKRRKTFSSVQRQERK